MSFQFNPANDTIPVGLCSLIIYGDKSPQVKKKGIVYTDRQLVLPWRKQSSKIVYVRSYETFLCAERRSIEPCVCDPMRPLHEQGDRLAFPLKGDFDLALVPCRPRVEVRPVKSFQAWGFWIRNSGPRLVGCSRQYDFRRPGTVCRQYI